MSAVPWGNETERADYWLSVWKTEHAENKRLTAKLNALEVDAVPVVRGEWTYEINEYFRTCSVCRISQALLAGENLSRFKYCPFCGADMRRESEVKV